MADEVSRQAGRTRIAVLGGGVGGMVTAFYLTSTPELRATYDVTVHQLGWRLGGKGASGRNLAEGGRIEEHGLHVWFGFYDNAFATMRACYGDLVGPLLRDEACPIRDFDDAFTASPTIGLYEEWKGALIAHSFEPPPRPSEPGLPGTIPSVWHVLSHGLVWFLDTWNGLRADLQLTGHEAPEAPISRFLHWADHFGVELDDHDADIRKRLESAVQHAAADMGDQGGHTGVRAVAHVLAHHVMRPLRQFKKDLWAYLEPKLVDNADIRLFFTTFDTFVSAMVGLLESGALEHGLESIDDTELSVFLERHGAEQFTLDLTHSPFLRGWYDAAFAFRFVNGRQTADLAAGTGIHGILRLIGGYRGHVAYKMRAGMGDTIFGPLYEVLRQRGVRFDFFRQVTGLELSADHTRVEAVRVLHQAEITATTGYEPLVDVGGLPCWPSEPDWAQLQDGARLQADGVSFEHGGHAADATTQVLRHGTDFDTVVLAIPAPALAAIAAEVAKHVPAFAQMLANCHSTMTQAAQFWTTRPLAALGAEFGVTAIATSFVEPIDTYCDMSHLLPRETWTAPAPQGLAYVCGVMDDTKDQASADAAARSAVHALLANHGTVLWPQAEDAGGGFDWSVLHDPQGRTGDTRIQAQYLRANFEPTERYVLSTEDSTRFRLRGDDLVTAFRPGVPGSGVTNLYLAGDWTRNGINGGCVEAATMSAMQTARAICGTPQEIPGEDSTWMTGVVP